MYQILCLCEEGTGFEETYMYMISCSDSPKVISLMSLRPSVEDLHHMTEPLLVDASQQAPAAPDPRGSQQAFFQIETFIGPWEWNIETALY